MAHDAVHGTSPNPDSVSFGAVATACSHATHWQLALALRERSLATGTQVSASATNAGIRSCAEAVVWEHALRLLTFQRSRRRGRTQGDELDFMAVGSALTACAHSAKWQRALAVLIAAEGSLKEDLDAACYGLVIQACQAAGQRAHMLRMLKESFPGISRRPVTLQAARTASGATAQVRHRRAVASGLLLSSLGGGDVNGTTVQSLQRGVRAPAQQKLAALALPACKEAQSHLNVDGRGGDDATLASTLDLGCFESRQALGDLAMSP
eukprot:TRINITY_DN43716_c0_g1_i1.p1 TRINITY_DN43716_c0_g1~~TRINITY_DN43716_c0_g1_i1.p1  ORF type:complete len:267 (+),score=40.64 TRINITY_DN43716_c0_g1_i1:434-1234(+)